MQTACLFLMVDVSAEKAFIFAMTQVSHPINMIILVTHDGWE